jgi:hypothetical protein
MSARRAKSKRLSQRLAESCVSGVLLAGDLLLGSMLRHARQRLKGFLDLLPRYLLPRSTMR